MLCVTLVVQHFERFSGGFLFAFRLLWEDVFVLSQRPGELSGVALGGLPGLLRTFGMDLLRFLWAGVSAGAARKGFPRAFCFDKSRTG